MKLQSDQKSFACASPSRRNFLKLGGATLFVTALPVRSFQMSISASALAQPRYPFPQHTAYTPGTIRPNHKTQGQLDQATQNFYRAWRNRYLRRACKPGQYVVYPLGQGGGKDPNSISVSEGHGYGMLLMTLMAGFEPQAQAIFDAITPVARRGGLQPIIS